MTFANSHSSFVSITGLLDDKAKSSSKAITHATMGSTTPYDHNKQPRRLIGHGGIIPLRITTILTLSVVFSVCFILVISFAFMGDDGDEPFFKKTLNDVAQNSPGVSDAIHLKTLKTYPGDRSVCRLFCWVKALMSTSTSLPSPFGGVSLAAAMDTSWPIRQGLTGVLVDYLQCL